MYVGPWQELRLSKLIDNVANAKRPPKHGRRAALGNETASHEFQALLAKLSELYGQDNADRLAAFMPLFESTMNDGSSEFGDSTMSAPTPGGGTPNSARSTVSRATDSAATLTSLLQPLPKGSGRSLRRKRAHNKKASAADAHRKRMEQMRQLYGLGHNPHEATCEDLIKRAVAAVKHPVAQAKAEHVGAIAGFPMTQQERMALVAGLKSPVGHRSANHWTGPSSPGSPGTAASIRLTIDTDHSKNNNNCFTTQQRSPHGLETSPQSPYRLSGKLRSPLSRVASPLCSPLGQMLGEVPPASDVGEEEVDDLLNWASNLGGGSPSATGSSFFRF